jgi:uncharacterized hydantoinase/oxoprolinase family protein
MIPTRDQEILAALPPGMHTTAELRKKFRMGDSGIRRILHRLVHAGYVAKEVISLPGKMNNRQTVGWRKLPESDWPKEVKIAGIGNPKWRVIIREAKR